MWGIRYIQILSMEIPIELNVSNFKERRQQNTENRFKPGSARQRIDGKDRQNKEKIKRWEQLIKEGVQERAQLMRLILHIRNMNTFLVHKENSLENVSFVMHTYIYIHMYIWYIYTYLYIYFFFTLKTNIYKYIYLAYYMIIQQIFKSKWWNFFLKTSCI